ncbi:MAG: hypothetical protein AAF669_07880 [Pseudomonadota bacterium]
MANNWRRKLPTFTTIRDSLSVIALLIGAAWAGWTFLATGKIRQAELQLHQLEQQESPMINVQIKARHWSTKQDGDTIRIEVTLTNQGKFEEQLNVTDNSLRVYPVQFNSGNLMYGTPLKPPSLLGPEDITDLEPPLIGLSSPIQKDTTDFELPLIVILPDEQQNLIWLYKAPEPHLYYVEFRAQLYKKSNMSRHNADNEQETTDEWFNGTFVEVPPS